MIDAASDSFLLDMLDLAADMNGDGSNPRAGQIDHFYIANLRGGDASHLMHLAAMAYYFTGEEQYRAFLFDELAGELGTVGVARTMMAFRLPDWCFKFYGDHITYGTHWQFITMLPDSELRDEMIRVMEEEAWQKALYNHHSAKFNVMYASTVPDQTASARQEAIDSAVRQLEGATITHDCDGRAGECTMADDKCADGLASEGLPPSLRIYADFMWQRSPFKIGDPRGIDGQKQSPGRDLAEPYWMARHYGYITRGAGQVLAWREVGACQ